MQSFNQRSLQIDVAFLARHQTRAESYLSFPSLSVSSLSIAESSLPLFASRVEQLDKAKTTSVFGLQLYEAFYVQFEVPGLSCDDLLPINKSNMEFDNQQSILDSRNCN